MATILCCTCGIKFDAPDAWVRERKRTHMEFFCPNGDVQYFPGESKEECLERILKTERQWSLDRAAEMKETKKDLMVARGQLTKARNKLMEE